MAHSTRNLGAWNTCSLHFCVLVFFCFCFFTIPDETASWRAMHRQSRNRTASNCVLDRTICIHSSRPPVLHGFDSLHKFRPDPLLMCMFHHYSFMCRPSIAPTPSDPQNRQGSRGCRCYYWVLISSSMTHLSTYGAGWVQFFFWDRRKQLKQNVASCRVTVVKDAN